MIKVYTYKVEQHPLHKSTEWLASYLTDMRSRGWIPISINVTGRDVLLVFETWSKR